MFGRIAAWAARHARAVLAVSAAVAIAAAVAAARLPTDAGAGTLVDDDSPSFQATEHVRRVFGDDPVVVLAEGNLQRLLLTANLAQLLRLEGCLAGNVPKGAKPIPGPCAELARLRPVKSVSGPASFLNEAVIGINRLLSPAVSRARKTALAAAREASSRAAAAGLSRYEQRQAAEIAYRQALLPFKQQLLEVASRYGLTALPSLSDPRFIEAVVFDLRRSGDPKAKLAYLFPNRRSAQIVIRLRSGLSDSERHRVLGLIRAAVEDDAPRPVCAVKRKPAPCFALDGGRYVVSGAPVVVDGLAGVLEDALLVLIAVAIAVMALTLLAVFRSRLRLLPLAIGLGTAALTFGLLRLLGGSLTMASIAVLPIAIGLAVDYAIQLQSRYDEAIAAGARGAEAARAAAAQGGPVVGAACLATAAGFLTMLLAPTPMVRGFGLMLVAAVLIGFGLSLTAGFAALVLRREGEEGAAAGGGPGGLRIWPAALRPRLRAARERLRRASDALADRSARLGRGALDLAVACPRRVLAIALALAVCGWAAGTGTGTISDIRELVPQSLREVRDLNELQDVTGFSGELDVSVRAPDLSDPAVIRWMGAFKQRVLAANGFSGPNPSCLEAEICPGPALSDFAGTGSGKLTRARVRALVRALPAYQVQQVASYDARRRRLGHSALMSFGIRAQSLESQQALIDRVRAQVDPPGPGNGPPAGVSVELAGLPVIAAESATDISRSRYWLTLAGLAAVALALLAVYRSASRALVPLVPIVLASGWAALLLAGTGVPLNPMSAALGALVIAIATEFSVILSARFHEERERGLPLERALSRAYARTGAAVLASGITATAGFAVLIFSDIRMLRDFGFVTVIDLLAALAGVMLVLPAALVLAEHGLRLPRRRRAGAGAASALRPSFLSRGRAAREG